LCPTTTLITSENLPSSGRSWTPGQKHNLCIENVHCSFCITGDHYAVIHAGVCRNRGFICRVRPGIPITQVVGFDRPDWGLPLRFPLIQAACIKCLKSGFDCITR
jgi:hypothetical protein